ncbi:MAG: sulfatase [Myxococcota bacterium]
MATASPRPDALAAVLAAVLAVACQPAPIETVTTLGEKLPGAEFEIERREIDFGRPDAHAVMTRGWGQDEGSGDGTFVWSVAEESVLSLFLARPRPLDLTLRARPAPFPSLGPQAIAVSVNDTAIGEIELDGPRDVHSLTVPESALVRGRNQLAFRYRWTRSPAEMATGSTDVRRVAVQWIHLALDDPGRPPGSGSPAAVDTPGGEPLSRPALDEQAGGFWLPPASRTVFHVAAPSGAWLELERLEGPEAVEVEIERRSGADGAARVLDEQTPTARFELAGPDDDIVRIALSTLGDAAQTPTRRGVRVSGRVRRTAPQGDTDPAPASQAGEVGAAAGTDTPAARSSTRRPDIVLYITDTLRADRIGTYGYARPTTPHLDAFARSAIVFERALAQAPYTRPSTASILTGLSPSTHQVLGMRTVLPAETTTLAEILHAAGYETAAFVANGNVIEEFGFAEGYDHFEDLSRPSQTRARGFEIHARHASRAEHEFVAPLNEYVFDWLDRRDGDRPLFLYVHAVEPHSPYNPPARYRERFAPEAGGDALDPETEAVVRRLQQSFIERGVPQAQRDIGSRAWLHALAAGSIAPTERVIADLEALYDAEVAYADDAFGALLAELERRGLLADAAVAFLSDHGEEFFEHGSWEHGKTLHAEVLRVPMILRLPGDAPRGIRVADIARHIDVLPTLLEAVGVPAPRSMDGRSPMDGRSLLPSIRGESDDRSSLAFVDLNGFVAQSIEQGPWKLIDSRSPEAGIALFSRDDPQELRNLAQGDPLLAGWLAAQLRLELARSRDRALEAPTTDVDADLEARLRAMGYVE